MHTRKGGIGTSPLFVYGLEDYYLKRLLFATLLQSYREVSKYKIKINKYVTKV